MNNNNYYIIIIIKLYRFINLPIVTNMHDDIIVPKYSYVGASLM